MSYSFGKVSVILLAVISCVSANCQTCRPDGHAKKSEKIARGCDPRKMVFKPTIVADGRLSYHLYKASKGIILQTVFGDFDSPSEAKTELERRAKFASKIIVRGMKLDPKGNVIGERVEALLPMTGSKNLSVFAVMWTSGHYFHEITSDCEEAALYNEKNTHDPD